MFNTIIIWILTFLLWLFPNWSNNQLQHLIRTNNTAIAAPKIISAIENKDVPALEALMCKNIKDNVENLPGKIGELVNAIEGEITNSTWKTRGSYQETGAGGRRIVQSGIDIYLTTSTENYLLLVMWETANNFAIEEVGIRGITLVIPNDGPTLADIKATEGIGEWHD